MRVLDLCAGRLGISRVFAARGHQVTAVDLVEPPEIPPGVTFIKADILTLTDDWVRDNFDFGWASTPCEQFSVHGMKHFHPNPPFPEIGLKLFNHARQIFEDAGIPYCMENVRPAQNFVGKSQHHCGPFHLWGNGVPILVNQGIVKGYSMTREANNLRGRRGHSKAEIAALNATIPPELANCVCDYAERLLEMRATA